MVVFLTPLIPKPPPSPSLVSKETFKLDFLVKGCEGRLWVDQEYGARCKRGLGKSGETETDSHAAVNSEPS